MLDVKICALVWRERDEEGRTERVVDVLARAGEGLVGHEERHLGLHRGRADVGALLEVVRVHEVPRRVADLQDEARVSEVEREKESGREGERERGRTLRPIHTPRSPPVSSGSPSSTTFIFSLPLPFSSLRPRATRASRTFCPRSGSHSYSSKTPTSRSGLRSLIGPLNGMKANVLTVAICCGSGIVRRWPETVNFHEHDGSLA